MGISLRHLLQLQDALQHCAQQSGGLLPHRLYSFSWTFFHMLNVRSKDESVWKRKDELKPYESADDSRLMWLKDAFLGYFDAWESTVKKRDGFSKSEKALLLLSSKAQNHCPFFCCCHQRAFTAS